MGKFFLITLPFLSMSQKPETIKKKDWYVQVIKCNNLTKQRRQTGENVFATHITDRRLISSISKGFLKIDIKRPKSNLLKKFGWGN